MPPLLTSVGASAALGALVGLIQQWRDQREQSSEWDLGGVRTYAFWAMLGCLAAFAGEETSPVVLSAMAVLVGVQQIITKANAPEETRRGSTTFAASLLTFFVGSLTFWRQPAAAVLVAALTMVLVGSKPTLHGWTRAFTQDDVHMLLQFAAITGVILPLVPNEDLGPFRAFNPFSIWLMVVLISGLGFAGYVAMRLFGPRAGILLASFFGGLASSTAATLAFSRRSKSAGQFSTQFALGVVVACTVMLLRLVIVAAVISTSFALELMTPFGLMAVPGILFVGWMWWRRRPQKSEGHVPQIANPLGLATALKFGVIYTVIAFLVKAAPQLGWTRGLLTLSFVSGLTNSDAILLSLAHTYSGEEGLRTIAVRGAVLAVIGNAFVKAGIAIALGSTSVKRAALLVLGATALIGVAWSFFPVDFLHAPNR